MEDHQKTRPLQVTHEEHHEKKITRFPRRQRSNVDN